MQSHQQFGLQRLSAFLNVFQKDSSSFKSIQSQTAYLAIWRQSIDGPLKNKCMPVSYENSTLSVLIHSQGWAQKFRFEQKRILTLLRNHPEFKSLQSIKICVQPSLSPLPLKKTEGNTSAHTPISQKTATLLIQVAETIHDEKLADSLRRIASRK